MEHFGVQSINAQKEVFYGGIEPIIHVFQRNLFVLAPIELIIRGFITELQTSSQFYAAVVTLS